MIYKFFRYWFFLIAGTTTIYTINLLQETKNASGLGGGIGGLITIAFVPLLVSIIVVSLCLAIFVATPKKVDGNQSNISTQNNGASLNFVEIAKLSILGIASVFSAYIIVGFIV